MNKKLTTICYEQELYKNQQEVLRLSKRIHTLQVQLEMVRGALKGLTTGLFNVEDL